MNALLTFLDRQPKRRLWLVALAFSLSCLGRVALATWSISRAGGLILSTDCAGTWLFANMLAGERLSSPHLLSMRWSGALTS